MLLELVVTDLALFESARLSFGPGLNVLTGETGAGKSLLVGALELLRGGKPRAGIVRQGAERALVEARFGLPPESDGERVRRWIARHLPAVAEGWGELEPGEERELVLSRSVAADGRTRAYVDQRPVGRALLEELAERLFEIHGQHDQQRLFEPSEQLRLLDGYGGLGDAVRAYVEARTRWQTLAARAQRLRERESERRDRLDLLRFQRGELEAAGLEPEERRRLEPERDVLRHAESLREGLANLVGELSLNEDALLDRLRRMERFLSLWRARVAALSEPAEGVRAALVHLEEAARTLESFFDSLEVDPARLDLVEGRLAEIERLERKYHLDLAGLVARLGELAREIGELEGDEASLGTLESEIAAAREEVLARGGELRRARKALRAPLVRAVGRRLAELGLEQARFDLRLGQRGGEDEAADDPDADRERFGERGMDRIEFLLAANPGEGLQRLRECASGGEAARIMLALRSVLAERSRGRTLVFDEIDTGVGGRLGPVVGKRLRELARQHQVLCVTHMPAIAAQADRHLVVRKGVQGGRTRAAVDALEGEARVEEVADMIAGGADQETARAEARRLLER
jgi:DNA repair protein RecN (Recombination protein N)